MMRTLPILVLAAAIGAGCSSNSRNPLSSDPAEAAVGVVEGQTFELRPGQTARVGTRGLVIGFRGVSRESRCPTDVQCVWQGDAEVNVQAAINRMAWTDLTLHTGVEPRTAQFGEYKITLIGLAPHPRATEKIPAQNYVATLKVE